jgi:toxin ParE1/3/4
MRVRYSLRALADIDEIRNHLEPRSPSGAFNVVQAIYASVRSIADQPYGSERTSHPRIRIKVVRAYRYKIFYSVIGDEMVDILHVRHASRRRWRGIAR